MSKYQILSTPTEYDPLLFLFAAQSSKRLEKFPSSLKERQIAKLRSQQETSSNLYYSFWLEDRFGEFGSSRTDTVLDISRKYPAPLLGIFNGFIDTSNPIISSVKRKVLGFYQSKMKIKALKILDDVDKVINQVDLKEFPPIYAFITEDNSLLIEWISPNWRIGFTIEQNEQESGWYLVSNQSNGNIRAYGDLEGVDLQWLVTWIKSRE